MKKIKKLFGDVFSFLRKLLSNYMWFGLGLILLSIILDYEFPLDGRKYYFSILFKLIEAVGLSIFISAIFSYAIETQSFVNYIKNLLENIIIKRNFLSNIDPSSKKQALKSLIQPSSEEINKYPNIANYYEYFIDKTLDISKKSVRSNYQISSRAYFDKNRGCIAIQGTYNYRLFPSIEGYQNVIVGFQQPISSGSFCSYVHAIDTNGKRKILEDTSLTETQNESGITISKTQLDITDFGKNHDHLSIELKVTEMGGKNWQLLQFKALQPTDGFRFELFCEEGITILDKAIFVVGATYYVNLSSDNKNIIITCNQWINEGSGIAVMLQYENNSSITRNDNTLKQSDYQI